MLVQKLTAAKAVGIGFNILGRRRPDGHAFRRQELDLQGCHDLQRDLVLEREDVAEVAVIALGPDVAAGCPFDQLGVDPHLLAGLANAALDHIGNAQFLGDLLEIHRLALVGEDGIAAEHEQTRDLRQIGDDVLGDAVAEELLLGIVAHVGEGQDRHRRLVGARRGTPPAETAAPVQPMPASRLTK